MKSILVPVEQHDLMKSTLQTALLLAKSFDSYVEGFALFPAMVELYALDPGGPLPIEFNENEVELAKEARSLFEDFFAGQGLGKAAGGAAAPTYGWLDTAPDGDRFVGSYGRVFDVTVLGRPDTGRGRPSMMTIEAGLFETGRPILIAPPTPPQRMGENVLIAWNCSTEQAHTVALAMPLLKKAQRVVVLTVKGGSVPGPSGEQVCTYLMRHGIKAEALTVDPEGRTTGAAILARAAALGSDLVVKGAYTQSRLRQMIFGGATRHILAHSNLPVLMAH